MKKLKWIFMAAVLTFMYAPIFVLMVYSFTKATQIGAIRGFTLDNYITLVTTEELRAMIAGTLILALVVAAVATVLGTLGAIGAFYSKRKVNAFISAMNQVPVVNADVVTAFSLCVLLVIVFGAGKETFIPLVIGQVTLCAPFVYLSVMPRLKQLDPLTYEAALDLGATPRTALTKIVLPQISSGITSGFMLSITLSLDDYFIATYLKPATFDTISTYVVNATKGAQTRIKTALWALSTVIFLLVVLIIVVMNLAANKGTAMQGGAPGGGGNFRNRETTARRRGKKRTGGVAMLIAAAAGLALGSPLEAKAADPAEEVILRVCSWEEYIDEGDWDEDEVIDLESGDIFGDNPMIDDFEEWYYETYGIKVTVEYSTFGTNEDLYNMLSIGDVYDLVCPSEYMFMMLMADDALVPLSDDFFDTSDENNYYINGVSPFIKEIFDTHYIDGESWSTYAAGYMWGVTGIVYNPEYVTREEASTWSILVNEKFSKQITIKDSVREAYFAAVAALKSEELTDAAFLEDADYSANLEAEMNDTSAEMIEAAGEWLQTMKDNVYSFESDSGKADMITGKVVANYQWSGDGVYTLDQAEEDDVYLEFAIPDEASNIYFDGWVMLKSGIDGDAARQHAAEAFINFLSRPDNAVRNMYYIGYTSCIAGSADDTRMFEYVEWTYGADDEEEDTSEYALGYFFTGDNGDTDYIITVPTEQLTRQLLAQYPDEESIARTSIMTYFDTETNAAVNAMWIQVRCYNINNVPVWAWICAAAVICAGAAALVYRRRRRMVN